MLPVVRTSSTSTIHAPSRPDTLECRARPRHRPLSRNAPRTFRRRARRSRSNWAVVTRVRSRRRLNREPAHRPGRPGDQRRLVVAAVADTVRRGRHRDEEIPAGTGARPAPPDGPPERIREAPVARVLEPVERPAGDAAERRAPFDLDEGLRDVPRQPDRRPRRQVEPRIQRRQALRAQGRALALAPGAGRREGEVQRASRQPADAATDHRDTSTPAIMTATGRMPKPLTGMSPGLSLALTRRSAPRA